MKKGQAKDPNDMTFLEHLEDFRGVIIKSLLVFILALIGVLAAFSYFNQLMLYPLNAAKHILAVYYGKGVPAAAESASEPEKLGPVWLVDENGQNKSGPYFILAKDTSVKLAPAPAPAENRGWYADIKLRSMSFTTPIIVYFYVGFLGALGITLPALAYFAAQFIAPGLTREEKKLLKPGAIIAVLLFCTGAAFAFFFMLPMGIAFMSWMSQEMSMEMFPDAQSYYSMVIFLTMATGATFELPLLEIILIYLGVLNVEWLKKNRRIVFIAILIFSAIVTPPDAITQVSLTIPLYLLYEVALRVGEKMRAKKLQKEAAQEAEEAKRDAEEEAEYIRSEAKKRLAEEKAEKESNEFEEIDKSHYGEPSELPDDYDPNVVESDDYMYDEVYGNFYSDSSEDGLVYPDDRPEPQLGPDWNLNRPDTSFFTPDWTLNEPPNQNLKSEFPEETDTAANGENSTELNGNGEEGPKEKS